jgi:uncharacterized protein YjdB
VSIILSDQDQVQLAAAALEADGVTADPNATIAWASDDEAIATVDANGLVASVADGTANITATASDPDGNSVESAPFAVTVVNESTDTKTVSVSAGTPEPKPAPVA